jgi:hypothetical protein
MPFPVPNLDRPTMVKPWLVKRALALHRMCEQIALDIASDVPKGKAYVRGQRFFNRASIARVRQMSLSISAIRGHYSRWKVDPTPNAFQTGWGKGGEVIIGPDHGRELFRRAIEKRLGANELYTRLKAEIPALPFSRATLFRALPVEALREVQRAQQNLLKAESAALRLLTLTEGKGTSE